MPTLLAPRVTDDDMTESVLPAAMRMVGAVRAADPPGVDRVLASLEADLRCDPATAARALVVALAACVPEDWPLSHLLAWRLGRP